MFKNKKRASFFLEDSESEILSLTKYCEWNNCEKKGEYKAPTSRNQLREFKWFCLEHIKLYNKGWDYFKGRTSDEIYKEISKDALWHRPTWERIKNNKISDIHEIFSKTSCKYENQKINNFTKPSNEHLIPALEILDIQMPFNLETLKKQYKKMVKKFHPDVSSYNNEDHIIKLNNAYSILLKALKP